MVNIIFDCVIINEILIDPEKLTRKTEISVSK